MICGVLALQGDFLAHEQHLLRLGVTARRVVRAADLLVVDRLVLPGGESSAMLQLMGPERLDLALAERVRAGMPVLATCAGTILLATGVRPGQTSLSVLDVDVLRNAYGRQIASTVGEVRLSPAMGDPSSIEGVFIRAPRIVRVGAGVEVLGRWHDDPVLVRQGSVLAASFHPELTPDLRIHRLFLELPGDRHG